MELHTIGIDLGKTVFHLVGITCVAKVWCARSSRGHNCLHFTATRRVDWHGSLRRRTFSWPALRERGHEVRLIPAQNVKPYVKTNKSDFLDAEAIAEAVARPTMRFVPIKTDDQLDSELAGELALQGAAQACPSLSNCQPPAHR